MYPHCRWWTKAGSTRSRTRTTRRATCSRARAGASPWTCRKLHDITSGPGDPNEEAININHPAGSPAFLGGNREFLTKKLWGAANERPYFHHGKFTTLRDATLAHDGEALDTRLAFEALDDGDQDRIIEFLKSLQVVPPQGR